MTAQPLTPEERATLRRWALEQRHACDLETALDAARARIALEALARKATPGPWEVIEDSSDGKEEYWGFWHKVGPLELYGKELNDNSRYIAACSPERVLALLARVRSLENVLRLAITRTHPNTTLGRASRAALADEADK